MWRHLGITERNDLSDDPSWQPASLAAHAALAP